MRRSFDSPLLAAGRDEILSVSRPDVVRSVHHAYLTASDDAVETNTFGTNHANLGEYGVAGWIGVVLSEKFQPHLEQSTDAIVVHHPEAKYFDA